VNASNTLIIKQDNVKSKKAEAKIGPSASITNYKDLFDARNEIIRIQFIQIQSEKLLVALDMYELIAYHAYTGLDRIILSSLTRIKMKSLSSLEWPTIISRKTYQ
jgi:hypothetical protein